jgi:hypothetical protein
MKYIRKEIIKGIEPIAGQDLSVGGNLAVAGNIAVTGTGLPTKSTVGLDFNDVFYEDVTNSLNAKTNAQNLGDDTRYWRLIVNDAVVASVTSTTSTAVSATHPLWTYNGNTYGMYNFATSSSTQIGSTGNYRVYKVNHLPGDVLEFDQTTEKFKPKRYDTLWDAKASGTGAAVLTSNLVNSVNGQTGAVTIATGGAVKQHSQYFFEQSATEISVSNNHPGRYDLVNGSTGITITKQDSATKLSAVTQISVTLTPGNGNAKYLGSVGFEEAFTRTIGSSSTLFSFGPNLTVNSPTHNVLADGNHWGNGSYNIARMGHFINIAELDTGGQYAANSTWTNFRIQAKLQPYTYFVNDTLYQTGIFAAITAVTTIVES